MDTAVDAMRTSGISFVPSEVRCVIQCEKDNADSLVFLGTAVETKVSVGTGPWRTKTIKWDDEWHSEGMSFIFPRSSSVLEPLY
jgi:hypothetical protein